MIAERRRSPFASRREADRVLAALAGVRSPPSRFIAIASVSCASRESEPRLIAPVAEALDDLGGGLDLVERDRLRRLAGSSIRPRSVARRAASSLTAGVFAVLRGRALAYVASAAVAARPATSPRHARVLEQRDRVRVPHVQLAVAPPRVDAADRQQLARRRAGRRGRGARAPLARAPRGRCRRSARRCR